jgi:hypothetical protein
MLSSSGPDGEALAISIPRRPAPLAGRRAVVAKLYEGLLFACVVACVLITIAGLFG